METTTPAPAARKKRSPVKNPRYEYFITKAGVPCRLDHSRIIARRPVLVKCKPGEGLLVTGAGYSAGKRRADRLIERTRHIIANILPLSKSPLYTLTDRMKEFLEAGEFKVEKRLFATTQTATTA